MKASSARTEPPRGQRERLRFTSCAIPAPSFIVSQEHHRRILGNFERSCRCRVAVETLEGRRIAAEVLLQGVDPVLVVGMIRQELWDLRGSRVLEILEQPYESPGIGPGPRADVG